MQEERINQEYNLSVSQFARLCNTTRDTLRHYYEIGLLTPKIDEKNGYHYYSSSQISSFYFISVFRQAGCSLKEINELIHDYSKENLLTTAGNKIYEMECEEKKLQQRIHSLNTGLWLLNDYELHRNDAPFLRDTDGLTLFKTPILEKERATSTGAIAFDIKHHLTRNNPSEDISAFPIGVSISRDDLLVGHYVYSNIISISQNKPDNQDTFALPSEKMLCCYHDHTKKDITDTYLKLVDYAKKNKLTLCSDLNIISLINLYNLEEKHAYFKYLFICVE